MGKATAEDEKVRIGQKDNNSLDLHMLLKTIHVIINTCLRTILWLFTSSDNGVIGAEFTLLVEAIK